MAVSLDPTVIILIVVLVVLVVALAAGAMLARRWRSEVASCGTTGSPRRPAAEPDHREVLISAVVTTHGDQGQTVAS